MRKGKNIWFLLLLLVGVGILAYPSVSNLINRSHGSYAIEQLQIKLKSVDTEEKERQRRLAEEYNALLGQEEMEDKYNDILDFSHGIMGYIRIPKIHVDLPIYHGVEEDVLLKGVGHLPNSAFPIGGEGNHAVLTGHTGLPSAKLFTDLTELEEGDLFYISILDETLAYRVDQTKVVLPSEGGDLTRVPGQDYCTLVTCTPYGINSHRLLVRGQRTQMLQEETETEKQEEAAQKQGYWIWLIPFVPVVALLILMRKKYRKTQ